MKNRFLNIIVLTLVVAGCVTTNSSSKQLERIAKDWCLSIRASQVIPVYPLTEDIQPGDVFLVQTPVEKQVEEFKLKGYLPLENLLIRLHPDGYNTFYSGGYGIDGLDKIPPKVWQFSGTPPSINYSIAPRAAFPSYTFSVSKGGGLNVALPVNAVPVGLNLLGSAEAHGSITIADAYTYGTDVETLLKSVQSWATTTGKNTLAQFPPYYGEGKSDQNQNSKKFQYLRVVTRVYLTGKVNVTLFSEEVSGSGLSAGVGRPVDLLNLASQQTTTATGDNYDKIIKLIENAGKEAGTTPGLGGTIKLAMASSRSVSLVETFPRPLIIGYIAIDIPILEEGALGTPVSTEMQLTGKSALDKPTSYGPDENTTKIQKWLKDNKENRSKLENWLSTIGSNKEQIPNIIFSREYKVLRAVIVERFQINEGGK